MCGRAAAYLCYMELSYSAIKKLQVVCLGDGKNLGRVCDVLFYYPENKIKGFMVTGGKFPFGREEQFVPVCDVAKVGEDVLLVKRCEHAPDREKHPHGPPHCPSDCGPHPRGFGGEDYE